MGRTGQARKTGRALRQVETLFRSIRNAANRKFVRELCRRPGPMYETAERASIRREFIRRGWITPGAPLSLLFPGEGDFSFETAPGGGAGSHHVYRGGLLVHLAVGGEIGRSLGRIYRREYGVRLDRDDFLVPWLLHDHMKPVVLRMARGGRVGPEPRIAGTRAHHILGLANLIALRKRRELVLSVASAHTHPAVDQERVVGFLEAASLLAGADPVRSGYLERSRGRPGVARPWPLGSFLVHLADRDWPLTTFLARK